MPFERRDPVSKARLFVPTASERALVKSQKELNKSLTEIEKMKQELRQMLNEAKGKTK